MSPFFNALFPVFGRGTLRWLAEDFHLLTDTGHPGRLLCRGKSVANFWLVVGTPTPLKNDGVKVSWDDEIPNIKIKFMFQTTNQ